MLPMTRADSTSALSSITAAGKTTDPMTRDPAPTRALAPITLRSTMAPAPTMADGCTTDEPDASTRARFAARNVSGRPVSIQESSVDIAYSDAEATISGNTTRSMDNLPPTGTRSMTDGSRT